MLLREKGEELLNALACFSERNTCRKAFSRISLLACVEAHGIVAQEESRKPTSPSCEVSMNITPEKAENEKIWVT
jgi:hypothetical protein